ncbi:MAG TPA: hypothetical protein VHK91_00050 [Flavisolibacter sp.]|nr:hypothetical protein [Flavisolibacter sp.]
MKRAGILATAICSVLQNALYETPESGYGKFRIRFNSGQVA